MNDNDEIEKSDSIQNCAKERPRVVIIGAGKSIAAELAMTLAKNGIEVIEKAEAEEIIMASDRRKLSNIDSLQAIEPREIKSWDDGPSYRLNFKTGKKLRY